METNRVEAFSDGVFAIAITLLILAVGIDGAPHGDLGSISTGLWPAYLAYAASFLTIGIMWINHHLIFRQFARVDGPMLILNVLLLMLIAFAPFPTRVVAEFARSGADRRDAALLYGLTMTITAICFNVLWFYGSRRLLHPGRGSACRQGHHEELFAGRADLRAHDAARVRQCDGEPDPVRPDRDLLCTLGGTVLADARDRRGHGRLGSLAS